MHDKENFGEESHLGKGLIRPTAIEVGIDGYHFSYEKPAPYSGKAEISKQKGVAERSVSLPEDVEGIISSDAEDYDVAMELQTDTFAGDDVPEEANAPEIQLIPDEVEFIEGFEPLIEEEMSIELKELEAEQLDVEVPLEVKVIEPVEEVYYSARLTWYGVPLPVTCRLTNRGVLITDINDQTTCFGLDNIAGVRLKQSFLAKILGIGNLLLELRDGEHQVLQGVVKPRELLEKLENLLAG